MQNCGAKYELKLTIRLAGYGPFMQHLQKLFVPIDFKTAMANGEIPP